MNTDDLHCYYSGLPSPMAYQTTVVKKPEPAKPFPLTERDIDRIIEMAWEDRTPFEAIEFQFGLLEKDVIALMRKRSKPSSFRMWRKRMAARSTKHAARRADDVIRFKCDRQRGTGNKIAKRK